MRKAVLAGLEPFKKEIKRQVTDEDVERLLKIPIRRISLYDINKAKEEMDLIKAKLAQVRKHLADLVDYADLLPRRDRQEDREGLAAPHRALRLPPDRRQGSRAQGPAPAL